MFRGKFLAGLKEIYRKGRLHLSGAAETLGDPLLFQDWLDGLHRKVWMVYSKPPFGGPEQVLRYLARYTHRVALSNRPLVRLDNDQVTFTVCQPPARNGSGTVPDPARRRGRRVQAFGARGLA
jgi:hypothetical protein